MHCTNNKEYRYNYRSYRFKKRARAARLNQTGKRIRNVTTNMDKTMAINNTTKQAGYSIGVVARLTGLTTHTLRMWERRYGLGSSQRTQSGQREYSKVDLDHLKIIKLLIDDGLRIGDIAKLPKKTLSALSIQSAGKIQAAEVIDPIKTIVIGKRLSSYFNSHGRRYPKLSLSISNLDVDTWMHQESSDTDARVFFLEIEKITKGHIKYFNRLSEDNKSLIIYYPLARPQQVDELKSAGITLLQGKLNSQEIDLAAKQAVSRVNRDQIFLYFVLIVILLFVIQ